MDPVTAIGLASALITFVEFSAKIIKRIDELSKAGDVPRCFKDVKIRLPLMVSVVTTIQQQQERLPDDVRQNVDSVVSNCFEHIQSLESVLGKVTVGDGDSKWKKGLKAFASFTEEQRVRRVSLALRDNIQILTSLNITSITTMQSDAKNLKLIRRASEAPPMYSETTSHFMLPFTRDPRFVGRQTVLAEIEAQFLQQSRVSIVGMGGIGKSQVAIEYAYRHHEANPHSHVFWVYGGSVTRFYQGYKRIAQRLKLPSWDDPDVSILELVSEWLNETDDPFLLILDNADDILHYWPAKYKSLWKENQEATDLSRFLPQNQDYGQMLITSRDSRVAGRLTKQGRPIALQSLTKDEAVSLFLSHDSVDFSSETDEAIAQIVQALEYLPLAITQAASFISENGITPMEYLTALHKDDRDAEDFLKEELHDARRDEESVNSAFRAWKVSFDQIAMQKPQAAELLYLLAFLDRQSIPRWLVNVPGVIMSLGVLQAFHMITARAGSETFQLHRLTQRFVQMFLKSQGKVEYWQDQALACVSKAYPTEIGVAEWPVCDNLAPHVSIVIGYEQKTYESRLDLANLLCWAADYDVERGMYAQALERSKRSLELYQELVPESDGRLASALWLTGRIQFYEAESEADVKLAEQLLQRALQLSNEDSITYAESAFELAYLYYSQDKELECLSMAKANFECWHRIGGATGVRTLDERHDYALQLAMFGHEEEAVEHWQEVLRLTPRSDAENNTKLVFTYRSTACIAEFQDDHQLARDFYSRLVALCSTIYNPEHVHVFDYQLSEAEQMLRQGKDVEALELTEVILENCQSRSEWRITVCCFQIMAECHRMSEDFDQELQFRHKSLELFQQKLGSEYPETYDAIELLSRCLIKRRRFRQAESLSEQVFDWRSRTLGRSHTETATAAQLIALCKIHELHDFAAEELLVSLLDVENLRSDRQFLYNLCVVLWNQQKWSELEGLCREGKELAEDDISPFHRMLAVALREAGKDVAAVAHQAEALQLEDLRNLSLPARLEPQEPTNALSSRRRFGRIIHPKTWSS